MIAGTAGPPLLLGDMAICARRAVSQARGDDLPPSLEMAVLPAHGTLPSLGHDHEVDAGQDMALRQAEVLELVDWEGLVGAPRYLLTASTTPSTASSTGLAVPQRNMWIHFAIAALVMIAALVFALTRLEVVGGLLVAISFVLITETLNTALEHTSTS